MFYLLNSQNKYKENFEINQLFLDSIRHSDTLRHYKNYLHNIS